MEIRFIPWKNAKSIAHENVSYQVTIYFLTAKERISRFQNQMSSDCSQIGLKELSPHKKIVFRVIGDLPVFQGYPR